MIKVKKGKKATARSWYDSANEPGATIEGRINGGVWQGPLSRAGSSSPTSARATTHRVRATDAAGKVDQSPASDSFTVNGRRKTELGPSRRRRSA